MPTRARPVCLQNPEQEDHSPETQQQSHPGLDEALLSGEVAPAAAAQAAAHPDPQRGSSRRVHFADVSPTKRELEELAHQELHSPVRSPTRSPVRSPVSALRWHFARGCPNSTTTHLKGSAPAGKGTGMHAGVICPSSEPTSKQLPPPPRRARAVTTPHGRRWRHSCLWCRRQRSSASRS